MADTTADPQIDAMLAPLVGLPAWGCRLGHGSFVTLEFGEPKPTTGGAVHGAWHLWVYGCAWRIEHGQKVLAGCDDERDVMATAIAALEGRVLQAVAVRAPAFDATWSFADDYHLRLFPISTEQGEHWLVYLPDGNVLSIGPGTSWSVESAAARSDASPE